MKLFTTLFLLGFILTTNGANAQKFRIASPPADGYFHMDTACNNNPQSGACYINRCVDLICDNATVYSSGQGRVLFCYTHGNKTYEVGIQYGPSTIVYSNLKKKFVQRGQPVRDHMTIGELAINPKDNLYHLGLQVAEAPNRFLWFGKMVAFLNARPVVN